MNLRWDALRIDHLLEHMDHIVELAMNVTDDDDGLLHSQHVRLVTYATVREKRCGQTLISYH